MAAVLFLPKTPNTITNDEKRISIIRKVCGTFSLYSMAEF
jgi:hypothetical protein